MDRARLNKILEDNKEKQFVQRILHREDYPVLDNMDSPRTTSTHSMATGEGGGRYFAYPTVFYNKETGGMKRYSDDNAWFYAVGINELVEFDTPEEALQFSKEYKEYWDPPEETQEQAENGQ